MSAACSFSASACAAVLGLAPFFFRGVDCLRFLMSWGFSKYRRRRVWSERDRERRTKGQRRAGEIGEICLAARGFETDWVSPCRPCVLTDVPR